MPKTKKESSNESNKRTTNNGLQSAEFLSDSKIGGRRLNKTALEIDSKTDNDKSEGNSLQFYKMGKQMISPRLSNFYPKVSKFFMSNEESSNIDTDMQDSTPIN